MPPSRSDAPHRAFQVVTNVFLDLYETLCEEYEVEPERTILLELLERVKDPNPVPAISFTSSNGETEAQSLALIRAIYSSPLGPFITSLSFENSVVGDLLIAELSHWLSLPSAANLRQLCFSTCCLTDDRCNSLLSLLPENIFALTLTSCGLTDRVLPAIVDCSIRCRLEFLDLSNTWESFSDRPTAELKQFAADLRSRLATVRTVTRDNVRGIPVMSMSQVSDSPILNRISGSGCLRLIEDLREANVLSLGLYGLPINIDDCTSILKLGLPFESIGITIPWPFLRHFELSNERRDHIIVPSEVQISALSRALAQTPSLVDFGFLAFAEYHKLHNPRKKSRIREKVPLSQGGALSGNIQKLRLDEYIYDAKANRSRFRSDKRIVSPPTKPKQSDGTPSHLRGTFSTKQKSAKTKSSDSGSWEQSLRSPETRQTSPIHGIDSPPRTKEQKQISVDIDEETSTLMYREISPIKEAEKRVVSELSTAVLGDDSKQEKVSDEPHVVHISLASLQRHYQPVARDRIHAATSDSSEKEASILDSPNSPTQQSQTSPVHSPEMCPEIRPLTPVSMSGTVEISTSKEISSLIPLFATLDGLTVLQRPQMRTQYASMRPSQLCELVTYLKHQIALCGTQLHSASQIISNIRTGFSGDEAVQDYFDFFARRENESRRRLAMLHQLDEVIKTVLKSRSISSDFDSKMITPLHLEKSSSTEISADFSGRASDNFPIHTVHQTPHEKIQEPKVTANEMDSQFSPQHITPKFIKEATQDPVIDEASPTMFLTSPLKGSITGAPTQKKVHSPRKIHLVSSPLPGRTASASDISHTLKKKREKLARLRSSSPNRTGTDITIRSSD